MNLTHRNDSVTYFKTSIPNEVWDQLQPVISRCGMNLVLQHLRLTLSCAAADLAAYPEMLGGSERKRPSNHWNA